MDYPVNYDSPSELKSFLESRALGMKKRFGQNFLVNRGAREKIISFIPVESSSSVWEIGPGLGAMTWHLLQTGADVTGFEIDRGFSSCLKEFYGDCANFNLIEGDFLKLFRAGKRKSGENSYSLGNPDFIIGNLPYVTGSVMTGEIIKSEQLPEKMVFTLQKEVGLRMAAACGSSDYSGFSIICQSKCDVSLKGDLKPGSFYPRPAVLSSIVELVPHGRFSPGDESIFFQLVDDVFSARRKKISNNLIRGRIAEKMGKEAVLSALSDSKISPERRAETLRVEEIEEISRILSLLQ